MHIRRWLTWCVMGVGLALAGAFLAIAPAWASASDGNFQIAMMGQIAASKVLNTDPQGNMTIAVTLELQTTDQYYPAVMAQMDVTEHINPKGTGTISGTASISDLLQRVTIFTADVQGMITTPRAGETTVTYTLINPHSATGSGGTLGWNGIWRGNRQGALSATAQGTLHLPNGLTPEIARAIWPGAVSTTVVKVDPTLWYLTRGAASAAYVVLVAATLLGMGISTQAFDSVTRRWRVLDLHQVLTMLMLALVGLHLVTLALDPFLTFTQLNLIWPGDEPFRPLPTALGVLALYALLIVSISSWTRRWFTYGTWRLLHYLSLVAFVLLTLHGILAGTDSGTPWMTATYVTSSVAVGALGVLRVTQALARSRRRASAARA